MSPRVRVPSPLVPLLLGVLAVLPCEGAPARQTSPPEGLFRLGRQVLGFTNLFFTESIVDFKGSLYILDRSILVSEDGDGVSRRISIRGANEMGIDARGRIFLNDQKMRRVEAYDTAGKHLGGFSFEEGERALAVMPDGTILVNRPQKGALLSAYSAEGDLLRSFGALKSLKDGNPAADIDEPHFASAMNWVHMTPGESGTLYVSFDHLPIVQKYEVASGKLLWETQLESPHLAAIQDRFWHPKRVERNRTLTFINFFFPVLIDVAFDPASQVAYVLSNDGRILTLDRDGRWTGSFLDEALVTDPNLRRGNWSLSFAAGRLYLTPVIKQQWKIFEVALVPTRRGR
jgi:hypothetical protein